MSLHAEGVEVGLHAESVEVNSPGAAAPGNLTTIPTLKGSNLTKGFSNGTNPHQPSRPHCVLNKTSCSEEQFVTTAAGGTSDHVHLLVSQSKNISLSVLLKDVKKDGSSWIKTRSEIFKDFHWQDGYGAFSISQSEVPGLKQYMRIRRSIIASKRFRKN